MPTDGTLTQKDKELVAVGASIAAGCRPCAAFHFEAARKAGSTEADIRRAVAVALSVRQSSTKIVAGLAEAHLDGTSEAAPPDCAEHTLLDELVSVGAALTVNCVTSLESHAAAATRLGASDRQIQSALGMARMVKKVAGQKVEAAAAGVIASKGTASVEADDGSADCGRQVADVPGACADQDVPADTDGQADSATTSCGCG